MRKKKMLLLLCLCITSSGFASTIPTYSITSVQNNQVTFSNGAIFQVAGSATILLQGWQTGQNAQLVANHSAFAPIQNSILDGALHTNPAFFLSNASLTLFDIPVTMTTAASSSGTGTYPIVSIDYSTLTLNLGAGGLWDFYATSTPEISSWQVGDLVMIGQETLPMESFDAILFNTRRQIEIPASEQ